MDRTEAYNIVTQYVKNQGLINHMLSVEAAMRFYAEKEGKDVEYSDVFVCEICGHTVNDKTEDFCPICGAKKEKYHKFS